MKFTVTLTLDNPIPRPLLNDVEDKLAYVSPEVVGFHIDPGRAHLVQLHLKNDNNAEVVTEKARRLIENMVTGWLPAPVKRPFEHQDLKTPNTEQVFDEMVQRKWVIALGPGQMALGGPALELFHAFDSIFAGWARELQAEAVRYPQMIATEVLDRCQYFSSFPHHVTFCSHLNADVDVLERFAANPKSFNLAQEMAPHDYVLNPAICFHTYNSLSGQELEGPRVFTTVGNCHRFESTAMCTLERLWDFTMREIIFVGTQEYVRAMRQRTQDKVEALMVELGMHCWIESANDPFFMTNFVAKKFHQLLTDAKFELQLSLDADSALAACSFNYHENFFGRSYGMTIGGAPAHTACTAFGLERWVYAFLCQFGLNSSQWPEQIREQLNKG